eukprot:TRINITY_DN17919_c0_g1_i1.p1 TRINITY_DN17919_c0_g1~~TRINITY_DN17919_c0_g1_i1.p1  ORF type:complete len:163 (-),score=4.63 TRINITY_DN17919_c0_g1_i1:60-506(-)
MCIRDRGNQKQINTSNKRKSSIQALTIKMILNPGEETKPKFSGAKTVACLSIIYATIAELVIFALAAWRGGFDWRTLIPFVLVIFFIIGDIIYLMGFMLTRQSLVTCGMFWIGTGGYSISAFSIFRGVVVGFMGYYRDVGLRLSLIHI